MEKHQGAQHRDLSCWAGVNSWVRGFNQLLYWQNGNKTEYRHFEMKRFICTVGTVLFTKSYFWGSLERILLQAGPWESMEFSMMTRSSLVKINGLIYWLRGVKHSRKKSEVALKKKQKLLTVWLFLIRNPVFCCHKHSVQRKTVFFLPPKSLLNP